MDMILLACIAISVAVGYFVGLLYPNPRLKEWAESRFKRAKKTTRKRAIKKDKPLRWG